MKKYETIAVSFKSGNFSSSDKSLWKIPFQALSPDGEKYLIEEKLISYAPSVSILLEQLKSSKPNRRTLQAFANSTNENRTLQYVNREAATVAGLYNSKPQLNATVADFERMVEKADIFHFSMHAEVDNEQPPNSFLGFRKSPKDDGRLTVEELLSIKLKQGGLAFLGSCDTSHVLAATANASVTTARNTPRIRNAGSPMTTATTPVKIAA